MSFQGKKPRRFSDRQFRKNDVSPKRFSLRWFLFISIIIHATLLWQFRFVARDDLSRFSSRAIVVVTRLDSEPGALSTTSPSSGKSVSALRARPLTRDRPAAQSGSDQPASSPGPSATAASGLTEGGISLGDVVTDGSAVGTGGVGVPAGTGGAGQGGKGNGAGIGGGTAKGAPGLSRAKAGPPAADRFAISVPPAIQRTTSPYESEVYAEIDFYTLFTPDLRSSVNVPANQVCLDGNIMRTYERQVISHTVTDISKCRYEDYGDDEKMRCPREAHTRVVTFDNYLSSPVSYSVNLCVAYDKSNCHWIYPDDGPEREVCRVQGKYEGIWAQGTIFYYPCAQSTSRIFSHPLQYEVRFVQDVEFPDERMRKRIVRREKRSVAQCQ